MPFEERTLTCQDCGAAFPFSVEDQEFFASRGYTDPKRCPACRTTRRSERTGGRGLTRTMFPAVCAACGKETEVPFEPKENRPVYCRDCYATHGADRYR